MYRTLLKNIFCIIICCTLLTINNSCTKKTQYLILEDGNYFNGKTFLPFKEIQIKDGEILAITNTKSELNATRINISGKYVVPGLIDSHVHFGGCPCYPYVITDPLLNTTSSLYCGVTTGVDLFYEETKVKEFKKSVNKSPEKYCSALMSGPILTAPGGHGTEYGIPTRTISSIEEAGRVTAEVASEKEIDVIKICYEAYTNKNSLTEDMVKKIVEVAHQYHKKVLAHIDDAKEAMDCVDAGVDGLAHMPYDLMTDNDLEKLMESGVIVIPTIAVYQSVFEGHTALYMSDPLLWQTANPEFLRNFKHESLPPPPTWKDVFPKQPAYEENLRNCIKLGIPILAGTDAGNYAVFYGYSLHREIEQYVKDGMTPVEALNSATLNIRLVFPDKMIGKITSGYTADLLILNANPLDNIENTKQIDFVVHKGIIAQKALITNTKLTQ
jgi:imidazolonepropionase-like amidohydrolase